MQKPKCPKCGDPSELCPPPPWSTEHEPDLCVPCQNAAEEENDELVLHDLVEAAMRSNRFDLL